jgi:hypothetical protein
MPNLTVDAELYQQATEAAAAQGKSVDTFVDESLRQRSPGSVSDERSVTGRRSWSSAAISRPSIPPKFASAWRRRVFDRAA